MNSTRVKKIKDRLLAEEIMSQYRDPDQIGLNLFELVVNLSKKEMTYEISPWVLEIASKFKSLYGPEKGEQVTREIISECMRENQTLH